MIAPRLAFLLNRDAPPLLGGLNGPVGLTFAPDGNPYVNSFNTDRVLRYNGTTGAFIGEIALPPDITADRLTLSLVGNDNTLIGTVPAQSLDFVNGL